MVRASPSGDLVGLAPGGAQPGEAVGADGGLDLRGDRGGLGRLEDPGVFAGEDQGGGGAGLAGVEGAAPAAVKSSRIRRVTVARSQRRSPGRRATCRPSARDSSSWWAASHQLARAGGGGQKVLWAAWAHSWTRAPQVTLYRWRSAGLAGLAVAGSTPRSLPLTSMTGRRGGSRRGGPGRRRGRRRPGPGGRRSRGPRRSSPLTASCQGRRGGDGLRGGGGGGGHGRRSFRGGGRGQIWRPRARGPTVGRSKALATAAATASASSSGAMPARLAMAAFSPRMRATLA